MIELVFIACLVAAPDVCEERSLSYLAQPSPVYCMIKALPSLAEWTREHPNYVVQHWKCEDASRRGSRA